MPLNTLPGVKAEIIDGQLRPRFVPQQPKVTLIGVTNNPNVVSGEPVLITVDADVSLADNIFAADGITPDPSGPVSKPSELSKAIAEAFNGGADNVEFVAIPDPTATNLKLGLTPTNQERFDGQEALFTLLKETPIDIVVAVGATIDATGLAATDNFAYQLANLCHQSTINERSCVGVIGVTPPVAGDVQPTLLQLETWVSALESFDTSSILGSDFSIGDGVTDAGSDGIPDDYAFWSTTDEAIPVGAPPRFDGDVETDRRGEPVDLGKYISVAADTVRFVNEVSDRLNPTTGFYHNNMAAAYAGLIASLPSRLGTTNRLIGGVAPVRALSPSQAERLMNKRYVTMRRRANGFVVTNGITWAYRINDFFKSDFTQLTTFRITLDAISFIRGRAQQFINKPNNAQVRAALETEIDTALSLMQRIGALNRYSFEVVVNPAQAVLGRVTIDLTIVPAFEITTITLAVALARQ
jgi:hypothetical protein